MYGNELPCFRLQYDPPTREKIEKEYFSPWKPLLDGEDYGFFNRTRAAEEFSGLVRNGDFDEGEANWIIRVIGGTDYAEKKDIERSINVAYQIAREHYAERVEATPEDLKRKLLAEIKITDKDEREWDYF